jgi:zinc/manganese transport system ATP-binding protein
MTKVLGVKDVTVKFGHRTVLDNVTFSIDSGQVTGLIGSNGAGKTTLLKVILGQQSSSGTAISRKLSYVPQKFLLDPDMPLRGRDVVRLGLDGHRFGLALPSKHRTALVDEALESVGAMPFANSRVGSLSGGEQQRILIAHALIGQPELLLLDEPLANLDLRAAKEVVNLLQTLAQEKNMGILISAHEMNTLLPVLDKIVYIADGRAVCGSTDEIIKQDVLSKLYGFHVDVINVHGRILVVAGEKEVI